MTDTNRRTDKEALRIMMELLIEHFQRAPEDQDAHSDGAEVCATEHEQVALPLTDAVDDEADEEDVPGFSPMADTALENAAPVPWARFLDEDPNKERSSSVDLSRTLYAKIQLATHLVPKLSMRKLMRAGIEAEADRLIALYYKPQ